MIKIKLFGGAKKAFDSDSISINEPELTIEGVINYLKQTKPRDTMDLDFQNVLIAINGIDSSALSGKKSIVKTGDTISIIPIIHGGSKKIQFEIDKKLIALLEVKGKKEFDETFVDNLRKNHPRLIIQAILSKYVLNKTHVEKILKISFESKKQGVLLSKKLETDILMRFLGTNQISRAIEKGGIKSQNNFIIISIGPKSSLTKLYAELNPLLEPKIFAKNNESFLKKEFKITKNQINQIDTKNPLEDLLAERAAILF